MTPILQVCAVTKSFREGTSSRTVLAGVNAHVMASEVIVLLGPSGSGKSTIVNLAAGMDAPDAGRVLLGGQDLATLSERQRTLVRRRRIGLVFQGYNLIPELTVHENVALRGALDGTPAPQAVEALLAEVGLSGRGHEYPDHLSGGEQQRVAVAAALCHEPELVLADEPTGALDSATAKVVIELLVRLTRGRGGALVLVTHNPEYQKIADCVWRLEGGLLRSERVATS